MRQGYFFPAVISFIGVGLFAFQATAQSYDDLARQQREWQQKRMQVDRLNANQIPTYQVPVPAPSYQPAPNYNGYGATTLPNGGNGVYGISPYADPNASPAAPRPIRGEGDCRHSQTSFSSGCPAYASRIAIQECGKERYDVGTAQYQGWQNCTIRVKRRVMGTR